MKSSRGELEKRGMASPEEAAALEGLSVEERIRCLSAGKPSMRSAAAISLTPEADRAAEALLERLSIERSLYTRLAICESLQNGNIATAEKMLPYLGRIGNNQHKKLPERVSAKKSYPLPRDIIARALGKMRVSVFPALLGALGPEAGKAENEAAADCALISIREALDAVGFMAFYHRELATRGNAERVLAVMERFERDEVLVWKGVMCLSAFPVNESLNALRKYAAQDGVTGAEALRSIELAENRVSLENA